MDPIVISQDTRFEITVNTGGICGTRGEMVLTSDLRAPTIIFLSLGAIEHFEHKVRTLYLEALLGEVDAIREEGEYEKYLEEKRKGSEEV